MKEFEDSIDTLAGIKKAIFYGILFVIVGHCFINNMDGEKNFASIMIENGLSLFFTNGDFWIEI